MKKIEKLNKELAKIEQEIQKYIIELKDTSYRRKGGYFGTDKADTKDYLIFKTIARTKNLNTYLCIAPSHAELLNSYKIALAKVRAEYDRINKLHHNKWVRAAESRSRRIVDEQIKQGFSNYSKAFVIGNENIYFAHPYYKHSDYNKGIAMPNTPRFRKIAKELNQKLADAGMEMHELI